MDWKLDDSRPIWMQLQEQLTRRILSGWYKAGEKLPSVRDLAAEAGVNPNTMQRALAAMDTEGLTVTNRTSGRTVTMDESILEGMRIQLAEKIIAQFYESVEELGYTKEQALELLERGIGKWICWICLQISMRTLTGQRQNPCVRRCILIPDFG